MAISLPAALRKALVHRTLRGLRFILGQESVYEEAGREKGGLEIFVAFRRAESEDFGVVADEAGAVPGIPGPAAAAPWFQLSPQICK
jgi:hypothetical protein